MSDTKKRTPGPLAMAALGFCLCLVLGGAHPAPVAAATDEAGSWMAVPASGNGGEELLFLIDEKQRYLSAYQVRRGRIQLLAGRDLRYDHPAGVLGWYSHQGKELTPEAMLELIKQARKK